MNRIRVLAVDDSAFIRNMLSAIINRQPDMEMVGTAPDPLIAREMIKKLNPDVLTLDIDMPRMDGMEFLSRLMRLRPMPVVMISSMTTQNARMAQNAINQGAANYVSKPDVQSGQDLAEWGKEVTEKIRAAFNKKSINTDIYEEIDYEAPAIRTGPENIIAIGSSTGGTEALRQVLTSLPVSAPGIVIAQHMPSGFTHSFAQRLNNLCRITVREARDGEEIMPGLALIAPGDRHMEIMRKGRGYAVSVNEAPAVNRHRPSVDVLFRSVAQHAGRHACAALLTGMGHDGAKGLLTLRQAGAYTVAQSEATCVVFGMPREAISLGAACDVTDLKNISQQLLSGFDRAKLRINNAL